MKYEFQNTDCVLEPGNAELPDAAKMQPGPEWNLCGMLGMPAMGRTSPLDPNPRPCLLVRLVWSRCVVEPAKDNAHA